MRTILRSILVCACGSESATPSPDGDITEPCEPAELTAALDHGSTYNPRGIAFDTQPWALFVKAANGADTGSLVIIDADGEHVLVTDLPFPNDVDATAIVFEGQRCAVYAALNDTLRLACDGGLVEDSLLEVDDRLVAISDGGTLRVFGQRFAAYTEARRQAGGWTEVEKFESSISSAEHAVQFRGDVVSCFLSFGDHPGIDLAGDTTKAPEEANWCVLVAGSSLGVLTDLGLTTFEGTFGSWTPTPVVDRPLAVGGGDEPFAIAQVGGAVVRQPLPQGTLETLVDAAGRPLAHIGDDRITVMSVQRGSDRTDLLTATRCR